MRESSKNYKTTLNSEYNRYQQKFADNLRKISNKGNNKITELRTILQRESQTS